MISPATQPPLSFAWSVASETDPDAFDVYRDSLADLYDVVDVAHRGRRDFTSRTTITRFGGSVMARASSVAQTFVRDEACIRRSQLDTISLTVGYPATITDFDGREVRSGGGSVQLRDFARPSVSRADGVDFILLCSPRHLLPGWLLNRHFHGLTLHGDSAGARLVASHLQTLSRVGTELSEAEGIAAVEAAFILASSSLGRGMEVTPLQTEAIHRTMRNRAMQIFDASPPGRQPGIDAVAHRIGVSRSSLYRAFESMGGVIAYVNRRRLDRVYAALRTPRDTPLRLDEMAGEFGFRSALHLRTAFVARFGFAPADVVPASAIGRDPKGMLIDRAAHDIAIDWIRIGEAA